MVQEGTSLKPENIYLPSDCRPINEVLARIGDKWTVLVVSLLGKGSQRFSELRRSIGGISQRMLTLTLRGLERDGLVTRTVYPTIPPRVDYELTPLGQTLMPQVMSVVRWAQENQDAIETARRRYDVAAAKEQAAAPRKAAAAGNGRRRATA
jgi:DNA-binding HxlR family transcriptional regulator